MGTLAVERLFQRMHGQLGVKISELFKGVPSSLVQSEWALGLAGFQPQEIERGLEALRARPFPPVLGEFARMCRPALDPEIAWREAVAGMAARANGEVGDWSHPAVYRAARQVQFELRTTTFAQSRNVWSVILSREFAAGWGDAVSPPAARLEAPKRTTNGPTLDQLAKLAALRARIVAKHNEGEASS